MNSTQLREKYCKSIWDVATSDDRRNNILSNITKYIRDGFVNKDDRLESISPGKLQDRIWLIIEEIPT